jgi:hypothetical protein
LNPRSDLEQNRNGLNVLTLAAAPDQPITDTKDPARKAGARVPLGTPASIVIESFPQPFWLP